jgi:hypothetical protein
MNHEAKIALVLADDKLKQLLSFKVPHYYSLTFRPYIQLNISDNKQRLRICNMTHVLHRTVYIQWVHVSLYIPSATVYISLSSQFPCL